MVLESCPKAKTPVGKMQPDNSTKEGLAATEDSCCTDETNTAATKLTRQNK